jgi:hypothetical protein
MLDLYIPPPSSRTPHPILLKLKIQLNSFPLFSIDPYLLELTASQCADYRLTIPLQVYVIVYRPIVLLNW